MLCCCRQLMNEVTGDDVTGDYITCIGGDDVILDDITHTHNSPGDDDDVTCDSITCSMTS